MFKLFRKRKDQPKQRQTLIEKLENRQLLSVTVTQTYPGFYQVDLNDYNSTTINVDQAAATMVVSGNIQGVYTNVQHIVVNCNDNGDTVNVVSNDPNGYIGCNIQGGLGNDTLTLDGLAGTIHGGAGGNALTLKNAWHSEVYGDNAGGGRIAIVGNCLGSTIVGGDNPYYGETIDCRQSSTGCEVHSGFAATIIYGSQYDDVIWATSGNDVVFAGNGDDTIYASGGTVRGGGGIDQAYVTPGTNVDRTTVEFVYPLT